MEKLKVCILCVIGVVLLSTGYFINKVECEASSQFSEKENIQVVEQSKQQKTIASVLIKMKRHFEECRLSVQHLSKNNLQVLEQFDSFEKVLINTYTDGRGLIEKDIHLIIDAIQFSAEKHQFQTRKNAQKTPYIIHPIAVAESLICIGKVREKDVLIAALLHDTVEDTKTTYEEIELKFGQRVSGFVRELTDDKALPKEERKRMQIVNAPHKSAGAAQIKLADKLHNLQSLAQDPPIDWSIERINAYFHWAQNVVDELPWVNEMLKQTVDDYINIYLQNHH